MKKIWNIWCIVCNRRERTQKVCFPNPKHQVGRCKGFGTSGTLLATGKKEFIKCVFHATSIGSGGKKDLEHRVPCLKQGRKNPESVFLS